MNFGLKAREDLEDAGDLDGLDQVDDPADDHATPNALDFRGGGTDLFRGVLVVLAALAVGAFIVTRGLDGADSDNGVAETAAAETEEAGDDALDSAGTDGTDDATDAATDPAMTSEDAMTDTSDPAAPAADDAATATTAATDGSTAVTTAPGETSTSTSLAETMTPRPPEQVVVVVLNATDQKGVAGKGTELLDLAAYNVAPADNVRDDNFGRGSVILYKDGYQADAMAVAEVFGVGLEGLVQPYDATAPPADDIDDANVIVILGIDDAIPIP